MKKQLLYFICTALMSSNVAISAVAPKSAKYMKVDVVSEELEARLKEILINGNQRIEADTIKSYLNFKVGDVVGSTEERQMISNLYDTDLFSQIEVKRHGSKLIVNVTEQPLVLRVKLEGNKKKGKDALSKELQLHRGDSFSPLKANQDIAKIKELYRADGRYVTDVKLELSHLENNRSIVVYKIKEGPKSTVRNIYFVGNKAYRDLDLKSVMMTKEHKWFRFFSPTTYHPALLQNDKEMLKNYYQSLGYADAKVVSATAELSEGKDYFDLTFVIDEGLMYQIASVKIENNIAEIDNSIFENLVTVKSGEKFNIYKLQAIANKITKKLSSRGFLNAQCVIRDQKNSNNNTVDVVLYIDISSKYRVRQINISGNKKTHDSVIRREFAMHEGDLYNQTLVRAGERKIRGLDFFETVSVSPVVVENDLVDLNVEVEDKSTAGANFQLSASTARSVGGEMFFYDRNLLGTGRNFRISGSWFKGGSKSASFGIDDPNLFESNLSAGISLGVNSSEGGKAFQEYNKLVQSGRLNFGYNVSENVDHDISYGIKKSTFDYENLDKDKSIQDPGRVLLDGETSRQAVLRNESLGKFWTSGVSNVLRYSTLDSIANPKDGMMCALTQEFAGLGGDTKFLKHEIDVKYAKSFGESEYTLLWSASAGRVDGLFGVKLRPDDRLNLGDFNLRGFAQSGIGPRLIVPDDLIEKIRGIKGADASRAAVGDGVGGKNSYNTSLEFSFPVYKDLMNLRGSVFVDAGALWGYDLVHEDAFKQNKMEVRDNGTLHASFGGCISLISPIGPLRACMAYPFLYEKDKDGNPTDDLMYFHFRMSTGF